MVRTASRSRPLPWSLFPLASFASLAGAQTAADVARDDAVAPVLVTASRSSDPPPAALLGASFTVIGSEDLRDRQVRSLADVLRDVPGASVSRSGPLGAVTQVRLRGAEANHTLVLVDGMEVADPFAGEYDFSALQVDEHARIEVLRGPQSALYGSDAIGGVIQYFTESGREAPGASVRAEGGSFGTREIAGRWAGASPTLDYAFTAGAQDTDGSPTARNGTRDIGAANRFFSAKGGWRPASDLNVRAVVRVSEARADFNGQDFDFTSPTYGYVIDTTDRSVNRSLGGLLAADYTVLDGALTHSLTVQGVDASRDAYDAAGRNSGDDGSRIKASYVATLGWSAYDVSQQLIFAADQKRERFRNTSPFATAAQAEAHHIDNTGLVIEYAAGLPDRARLDLALRHDRNEHFRDATTYRVQASWLPASDTKLHVAAGSGIKNPTPIELFGYDPQTFVGNPALKPEKSKGWEAGIEQALWDRGLRVGFVWARSRLEDEIYTRYSPTFIASPDNRGTYSHQRSAELYAQAAIARSWRVDVAYTWLDAREDGVEEVRRAPRSGSVNVTWSAPGERLDLTATARYNGAMQDFNFTNDGPPRVTLGSYTLVQLGAQVRLRPALQLYARVENLLGERYEDVYTYRMPGRAGYAGVRAEF